MPGSDDRQAGHPHAPAPSNRRSLGSRTGRWAARLAARAWERMAVHAAIGPDDPRAAVFGRFGTGTCLMFPQGARFGERYIHLGDDTLIGPNVCLTAGMVPGQTMITDPVVSIGSRCMIGRGSHIIGHFRIEIGDDVHTGPYVYITDQNHGYEDPDTVIHAQWPNDEPVSVGDGSWLGANAVLLPGTRLGAHVVVAAGAVVSGTFPDNCVVAGVPARMVKRYVEGRGWVRVAADGEPLPPSG